MKKQVLLVKPRRIIEFVLFFLITLFVKKVLNFNANQWGTILIVIGGIAVLLAVIFIIIEVHSNESIDTGKAILEYEFESEEEMRSMPSNFWYNRTVTNKSNTLISPELIAGVGTALIFKNILFSIIAAVVFWIINYVIRSILGGKREELLHLIGKEGEAVTDIAWKDQQYLGTVKIDGKQIKVKIDNHSAPISAGDIVEIINLEGSKYIVRNKN